MPRNVRNFWIEAEVDGRKTPIAFGPQGGDGGFRLTIFMRNEGEVEEVAHVEGACHLDGRTLILWFDQEGTTKDEDIEISRQR